MGTPGRARVLLAEDSPELAHRLVELVEEAGNVELAGWAQDGAEAWRLFARVEPEVMILDLNMPVMGGLEVLRRIRDSQCHCVVMILTNLQEASIREQCLRGGADYFLQKSLDLDLVVDILRRLPPCSPEAVRKILTGDQESDDCS